MERKIIAEMIITHRQQLLLQKAKQSSEVNKPTNSADYVDPLHA